MSRLTGLHTYVSRAVCCGAGRNVHSCRSPRGLPILRRRSAPGSGPRASKPPRLWRHFGAVSEPNGNRRSFDADLDCLLSPRLARRLTEAERFRDSGSRDSGSTVPTGRGETGQRYSEVSRVSKFVRSAVTSVSSAPSPRQRQRPAASRLKGGTAHSRGLDRPLTRPSGSPGSPRGTAPRTVPRPLRGSASLNGGRISNWWSAAPNTPPACPCT
jgi:hypothetical protein